MPTATESDALARRSPPSIDADRPVRASRGFWRAARSVVLFSLSVTAAAAVAAGIIAAATDSHFLLAFVILRWLLVGALLTTPLVHQISVRLGATWRLPWALTTPATALLLTCESICFDILSAQL